MLNPDLLICRFVNLPICLIFFRLAYLSICRTTEKPCARYNSAMASLSEKLCTLHSALVSGLAVASSSDVSLGHLQGIFCIKLRGFWLYRNPVLIEAENLMVVLLHDNFSQLEGQTPA